MYHRTASHPAYVPPSENPARFSADINTRITNEIEVENEIARAQATASPLRFGSVIWRVATRDDIKSWMAHYQEPTDNPEVRMWQPMGQSWATDGTFQPIALDSRQTYHALLRGAVPERFWIRVEQPAE